MLPQGFEPTDEWAKGHLGMSLADFYKSNPGAQNAYENSPSKLIQNATDAYQKQLDDYNTKYKQFNDANPFVLDDVLASEAAKAKQRLDPYYQQTLSDFLTGVNAQRSRSAEDRSRLLSNLAEDTTKYTGDQGQALQDTLDKTRQGFAGNGLYNSGANLNAQGRDTADTNNNLATNLTSADRTAGQINQNADRSNQDLTLQTANKTRDLNAEESYNVNTAAQTGAQQDQAQRQFNLGQFTGPPPGQDSTTFQNSLYSLLN